MYNYIILTIIFIISINLNSLYSQNIKFDDISESIKTGELNKAVSLLEKYIYQNPDSINAYILLGNVHLAIGGPNHRSEAVRVFRDALYRDSKNVEIIKKLAEIKGDQKLTGESTKWLEYAFKLDEKDLTMLDQLLDHYIEKKDQTKIMKLREHLEKTYKENPDNSFIMLSLAKLEMFSDHAEKAIPLLENAIKRDPDNPVIHKELSKACLVEGYGDRFTNEYYKWLEMEQDAEALQREYDIAEFAMSYETRSQFHKLPFQEKRDFLIQYWREHDPYPVSVLNERLMEHVRRVMYSELAFHNSQSKIGFDDRGMVYIRWGAPDQRYNDIVPAPITVEEDEFSLVRDNESWYYPSLGLYMYFDFIEVGGYFQEIPNLSEALYGGSSPNDPSDKIIRRIYEKRSHLGGIYQRLAYDGDIRNSLNELKVDKTNQERNIVPKLELELGIEKLHFSSRIAQFRGDSNRTEVDLVYGVPLNQINFLEATDSTVVLTFQNDFILFDSHARRNHHVRNQQSISCPSGFDYSGINYISEEIAEVYPGKYTVTFQIIERTGRMGDYIKKPLYIHDFSGTSLLMSDLKFSQQIMSLGIDSVSGIEKFDVSPYPFDYVRSNKAILLYFEIYNLSLVPDKGTNYEISLKMEREIKKGEYAVELLRSFGRIFTGGKLRKIETSYQRQGNSQFSNEYIELDLSALNQGHSRLTVIVKDLNMNKEVENSIEFDLKE